VGGVTRSRKGFWIRDDRNVLTFYNTCGAWPVTQIIEKLQPEDDVEIEARQGQDNEGRTWFVHWIKNLETGEEAADNRPKPERGGSALPEGPRQPATRAQSPVGGQQVAAPARNVVSHDTRILVRAQCINAAAWQVSNPRETMLIAQAYQHWLYGELDKAELVVTELERQRVDQYDDPYRESDGTEPPPAITPEQIREETDLDDQELPF
jgi:hypothetical protein